MKVKVFTAKTVVENINHITDEKLLEVITELLNKGFDDEETWVKPRVKLILMEVKSE